MHLRIAFASYLVSLVGCSVFSATAATQLTDPVGSRASGLGASSSVSANEPLLSEDPAAANIQSLAWLTGQWLSQVDGTVVEEHWMVPRGGMMLGVNRTTSRSGRGAFEFMRIAETEKGLVFYASPNGEPATAFAAIEVSEQRVVFENTKNDFPKRIHYHLESDALRASIEGEIDGKPQSMSWNWKRVQQK